MTDSWLRHVMPELPTAAELAEGTARLKADLEAWDREDANRSEGDLKAAASVRNVVTIEEAMADLIADAIADHPPAILQPWRMLEMGRPITAGELVVICARPGVGKTWVLLELLESTLKGSPQAAAAFLEMEMLPRHLAERLAGHALRITPREINSRAKSGDLTVEQIMTSAQYLAGRAAILPKQLAVGQLPEAIDAVTERLGRRPTILVVDYMGLLGWTGHPSARTYERASENARNLKEVALEEGVVILAAAQLSRAAGDGSTRPTLDALRDSGVIEEAADRILGLWRDTPIEDEQTTSKRPQALRLAVLKNRHGRGDGETELEFDDSLRLIEPGQAEPEKFPFDL